MPRSPHTPKGYSTASHRLRTLSPKTVAAILLMAVMGVLWFRVATRGRTGPTSAEAASLVEDTLPQAVTPVRIVPKPLPVVPGRNDMLICDFFSQVNWPGFGQTGSVVEPVVHLSEREQEEKRHKAIFDSLTQTLNLDAIIQASGDSPARVCVDGKVLTQGQALTVKREMEKIELTVSEIGEHQVVLTWKQWSVVLKMAQTERVD